MTRRRDSSSLKMARSRNSRQTYSAPIRAAGGPRLAPADRRDRLAVVLGAAAVAGGHRGDRHGAAGLAEQGQGPRALELDVVGVGVHGQDADRRRHGKRSLQDRDISGLPPRGVLDARHADASPGTAAG